MIRHPSHIYHVFSFNPFDKQTIIHRVVFGRRGKESTKEIPQDNISLLKCSAIYLSNLGISASTQVKTLY